jgi:hypothetical protein
MLGAPKYTVNSRSVRLRIVGGYVFYSSTAAATRQPRPPPAVGTDLGRDGEGSGVAKGLPRRRGVEPEPVEASMVAAPHSLRFVAAPASLAVMEQSSKQAAEERHGAGEPRAACRRTEAGEAPAEQGDVKERRGERPRLLYHTLHELLSSLSAGLQSSSNRRVCGGLGGAAEVEEARPSSMVASLCSSIRRLGRTDAATRRWKRRSSSSSSSPAPPPLSH